MLCAQGPVGSIPALSLESEFTRSHGSFYKALALGSVDGACLRRLFVSAQPAHWPLVFAIDASTWPAAMQRRARSGASTTRRHDTPPASRSWRG